MRDAPYYEEYAVGQRFRTLGRTVRPADLALFVNLAGFTEPLFQDEEYAKGTPFGRPIVPGLLTLSVAEGLIIQSGLLHDRGLALVSLEEVRFRRPVFPGDTLRVEGEVAALEEGSRPDGGMVTYRHQVVNQHGEVVLRYTVTRLVRKKGGGG